MKVQSNLSPRNNLRILANQVACLLLCEIIIEPGIMRVCANSGVNGWMCFPKLYCAFKGVAVWITGTHIENNFDTSCERAFKNELTIRIKLLTINVRVKVDEHRPQFYFNLAPFGTSSVKVAITGRPSSPYDAATTIPCDSNPRSLRGFKLATITTFRSSKLSGS